MVGGVVTQVLRNDNRVWVNCRETQGRCRTECAVYVERNETSERIRPGDMLWWQGRDAMWTPQEHRLPACDGDCGEGAACCSRGGVDYDICIPRIGYSGVSHPAKRLIDAAYEEVAD